MTTKLTFQNGETIFSQGSISDCAYIIEKGSVEILETLPNGEMQLLCILRENEIFGEIGLIDGLPRSATARAQEDCIIYVLTKEKFENLSKYHPEALMPILKVLTSRLRETLNAMRAKPHLHTDNIHA